MSSVIPMLQQNKHQKDMQFYNNLTTNTKRKINSMIHKINPSLKKTTSTNYIILPSGLHVSEFIALHQPIKPV